MDQLDQQVILAKTNETALEDLINQQKSYILRCASKGAGRFLSDSDDEWSIALMAFNDAVQAYDESKGTFLAFAATVIRRRVIDYMRSQQKYSSELSVSPEAFAGELDDDPSPLQLEVNSATAEMADESDDSQPGTSAAKDEIEAVQQILEEYGFSFFDLTDCSPKAGKTKEQCGKAIAVVMLLEHPPLLEKLRSTKMLPIKELSMASGVSRKVIERHRKYIIACAEILSGDFPILGDYLSYVRKLASQGM